MKKASLYLALSASIGLVNVALADDMSDHIFSETISGEIQTLSDTEMETTQGEWGPYGALGGGILGGIGYAGGAIGSGSWDWYNFGQSVAMGGLGGFAGGPASWYYRSRAIFGGGVGFGVGSSFF